MTISIVGYGSFGTLLHTLLQRFVPAVEVRINSSRSAPDGVKFFPLTTFLKRCGFDVVEMSAEQHDRHLAETLFLTHFIGQIVARGGFNRTEIDTVSFGYLMDAVESVRHDIRLFEDVFRFNPYCEEVLRRFEIAESEVHALLKKRA